MTESAAANSDLSRFGLESNRFLMDLEFIQNFANPMYLNHLAIHKYFESKEFMRYLRYLTYWKRPEYARFLKFPQCLAALDSILAEKDPEYPQSKSFTAELMIPQFAGHIYSQQVALWMSGGKDSLIPVVEDNVDNKQPENDNVKEQSS